MHKFLVRPAFLAIVFVSLSGTTWAQWLKYPTAGVPRTADGKPNLSAPAPRTADGKPDFSGIWLTNNSFCQNKDPEKLVCGSELPMGREGINIGASLNGGLPYQPWLAALVKTRTADMGKDDPHIKCMPDMFLRAYSLPHLLKFVQAPGLLVMLDELNASYRQIFTDGRPLPEDPNPSWQGYSSAKFDGDTLVVNSIGFRDDLWIDTNGSMITSAAKIEERIRRLDYGHLDVAVTVDDPKAYTRPWTVTLHQRIALDTDLVDEICLENEKDTSHLK
ncbi:MAG TPA: hypothetical protein VGG72_19855 [Bryobacteraceae bacterium]|jgi:hypothetical protein